MRSDYLIVGGGIAGASAGYFLAPHGRVTILEREPAPGQHSTGRSAAVFSEYYGNRTVRALAAASRDFLLAPPDGFAPGPVLTPRGAIALAAIGTDQAFGESFAEGLAAPTPVVELDALQVQRHCPIVRPGWYGRAMFKPAVMDIDVDRLHQGFLRGLRAAGGTVVTGAEVRRLGRVDGLWRLDTTAGEFEAPVAVNAAGAWADDVAALAGVATIGLVPLRRTAFVVDIRDVPVGRSWPLVGDVADTFYFKPESGGLLVSPADSTPSAPGDARPDELDVATGVGRFEQATTARLRRVRRAWAGLRPVVPDGAPVIGESVDAPGFFWLAALGGFGVQSAPAAGRLLAAAVRADPPRNLDRDLAGWVSPERLRPGSA